MSAILPEETNEGNCCPGWMYIRDKYIQQDYPNDKLRRTTKDNYTMVLKERPYDLHDLGCLARTVMMKLADVSEISVTVNSYRFGL